MAANKAKKAKNKTRTLATRTLSGKRSGEVKGGDCVAQGSHYKTVIISMRKAGGDPG